MAAQSRIRHSPSEAGQMINETEDDEKVVAQGESKGIGACLAKVEREIGPLPNDFVVATPKSKYQNVSLVRGS